MPVFDGRGFRRDNWRRLGAEEPIPVEGRVIVPLERLAEAQGVPVLGLDLTNDTEVDRVSHAFGQVSLIVVAFPSFADGRGFSLARRLRAAGYRGALRASGHVIADQFGFARACGFDEVEIDRALAARQPETQWLAVARSSGPTYQRGYGEAASILDRRRAATGA